MRHVHSRDRSMIKIIFPLFIQTCRVCPGGMGVCRSSTLTKSTFTTRPVFAFAEFWFIYLSPFRERVGGCPAGGHAKEF